MKKGEKACEIDYAPSIETEGDVGYCVLADGFGLHCTVGKQALCGLSMKLAALARPRCCHSPLHHINYGIKTLILCL